MLQLFFSLEGTSIITSNIINHKSSSHKALDPLYNKLPIRLVDQYFYSSPAGDAIPDRLKAVIGNLPAWIREAGKGKKKIDVVVPGSGPARDIINILSQNSDLRQRVKAYCIDNEPSAIELGMYLAKNAGVADNIQYIEEDFMKANLANMDLALLVGIICPLSNSISAKVINKVKSFCRDGGLIVFSAALQKMLFHDPVTCFVMDFIDWKLHYKSQQDLRLILKNTKLIEIGSFLDPKYQFHQIIIGRTR